MSCEEKETGCVYWVTGLSGAGKTTIGKILYNRIRENKDNAVFLDGDILRGVFQNMGGFSVADRMIYASAYGRLCRMLSDQGIDVVCCTVSMFDEVRKWNRENIPNYKEIFLDVPLAVLRQRDQKGLYSKAARGEAKDVVGLDQTLEMPKAPDVKIANDGSTSPQAVADEIWRRLGQ